MNDNNSSSSTSESTSIVQLFEEKLLNFKTLYFHRAAKIGLADDLAGLTMITVASYLITARLFWELIENQEEDALLVLLKKGAEGDDRAERFQKLWEDSLPEDRELLWRYVKFFLHCVQQLQK